MPGLGLGLGLIRGAGGASPGDGGGGANPILALSPAAYYRFNTGITVTGSGVSQWNDQSGNSRHLLQATDAARPPKQTDGSILFDGTAQFLKANAFTLNQPVTFYVLFKPVTFTNNDYVMDGNATSSASVRQAASTPTYGFFAGTTELTTSGPAIGSYGVLVMESNGASGLIQLNNNTPVTGNAGASNPGGFTLAASGAGGGNFGNIQVKEVAIFNAAHDAATRAAVVNYLLTL